jgi:hypothetical protein
MLCVSELLLLLLPLLLLPLLLLLLLLLYFCTIPQAQYAAALAKYKASVFTDSLSDEELAAAQTRFNEGMKLFNRGVLDKALVIFDEVGFDQCVLHPLAEQAAAQALYQAGV